MTAPQDAAPVLRTEDHHLITGQTRWTANIRPQGLLHLTFVRSPVPHARFTIDVEEARRAPGVVAVWTGADLARWCPELSSLDDGPNMELVATDTVRYVGEAVAVIVARSSADGIEASEVVDVDYDMLPAVADVVAALADGAPLLHETVPAQPCLRRPSWTGRRRSGALRR